MTLTEDLLNLQIPQNIQLSPDGRQLVYFTTLVEGHTKLDRPVATLWLAQADETNSSRQITSGLTFDRLAKWSPNGHAIAFLSDRGNPGQSCAIWMFSVENPGEAYNLTPVEHERHITDFKFSPNGETIAFVSADEKSAERKAKDKRGDDARVWGDWSPGCLRLVNISTKKVTALAGRGSHLSGIAWSGDGRQIAITESKRPDVDSFFREENTISVVDVVSQALRRICSFPTAVEQLHWAGDTVYFLGSTAPQYVSSSNAVYAVDLKDVAKGYSRCAHGEDDCAEHIIQAGGEIVVHVLHRLEDQIRILNGDKLFIANKAITSMHAVHCSNGFRSAVAIGDINHPTEVCVCSNRTTVQVSRHGEALADRRFGTSHLLRCSSSDGLVELDALYLWPHCYSEDKVGIARQSLPTIVLPHGGPYDRSIDQFDSFFYMWSPLLLSLGYGILLPNYRGGSGRGEGFAAYGRHGGCGVYDIADVLVLTNHAIDTGYADKERLIIAGWSHGATIAFLCSVRNGLHGYGWRFQAAITGAGITDGDVMSFTSDFGAFQTEVSGRTPWQSVKDDISGRKSSAIWEFSAAARRNIIPPMLLLHGERDGRIPLEQSVGFRRALESVGLPFEYVTYPREPHLFRERAHIAHMLETVAHFIEKYLEPGKRTVCNEKMA